MNMASVLEKQFEMPYVSEQEAVQYKPTVDSEGWGPAFIMGVGHNSCKLAVLEDRGATGILWIREGCRHEDDPWLKTPAVSAWQSGDGGIFRKHPENVKILKMYAAMEQLQKTVESLVRQVDSLKSKSGQKAQG
jgi:hypothetical protein